VSTLSSPTWQSIQAEVTRRIAERTWLPGELIPGEVELADEFGCARATVNRALRQLAEAGFLDRRRKAGTRVALHPVRKATLDISITRREVELRGAEYSHILLERRHEYAPRHIQKQMQISNEAKVLHLRALHMADKRPFVYEDRWVNTEAVPDILTADFGAINANEWLVQNASFTTGDISFSAANASGDEAKILGCNTAAAIFIVNRITWTGPDAITAVRLAYAPGFQMQTTI
jgi:GntR family histidine utilization transcriptional repressor